MAGSRWEQDAWVDVEVQRLDPVRLNLEGSAVGLLLEDAGSRILRLASQDWPRRRRVLRAPRRLVLVGALMLGASGAAAAATGVFVNANTHTYVHTLRHGGGTGELLNSAGTNYTQVVQKDSAGAGITYPADYVSWRVYAIKHYRLPGCGAGCSMEESTGSININIAQSAFCAWILQWRGATRAHDTAAARQAVLVIKRVSTWKALAEVSSNKADYAQSFGWMKPFVRAVSAGNVGEVDALIASQAGSWFWFDDPGGFANAFGKRINSLPRARQKALGPEEGSYYLRYLNRYGS